MIVFTADGCHTVPDEGVPDGRKNDFEKDRWDLLPVRAVKHVVKVLTWGAKKYAPDNWKKVENAQLRYYAAALRHIIARAEGEKLDPESGMPHLAHAICCLIFIMEFDDGLA